MNTKCFTCKFPERVYRKEKELSGFLCEIRNCINKTIIMEGFDYSDFTDKYEVGVESKYKFDDVVYIIDDTIHNKPGIIKGKIYSILCRNIKEKQRYLYQVYTDSCIYFRIEDEIHDTEIIAKEKLVEYCNGIINNMNDIIKGVNI